MCAWAQHETRFQLHTREIVQQKKATLARDVQRSGGLTTGPPAPGDLLRRGRDPSHNNSFAVLTVVQIRQPSEEPRTMGSCCTWFRNTGGQQLIQESVAQLRHLDRAACVACDTIMSRRCRRCSFCKSHTPLGGLVVGDTFQDRRQPGHQDAAPEGSPTVHQPLQSSQPVPPGDLLDDSPASELPHPGHRSERDKQLLAELRRATAMALPCCIVSRYATAWAESLEGAISDHQSLAVLCLYRCRLLLAEDPKGTD